MIRIKITNNILRKEMLMSVIRITTIPMFSIIDGDDKIITHGENPKKLWTLFKLLLVRYEKPIHYEVIYECISENKSKNIKNLIKNMIYRLRKMLNEMNLYGDDLVSIDFINDSYIMKIGKECNLDLKYMDNIKVDDNDLINHDTLLKSDGNILQEERFAEWLLPMRSHYKNVYLNFIKAVGDKLYNEGELDKVIDLTKTVLEIEPDEESISALLLKSYIKLGNRAGAINYYYKLEDRLYEEYGIEPSDEIQMIFNSVNDTKVENNDIIINLKGAFSCNFLEFQSIYQLEKRKAVRGGTLPSYLKVKIDTKNKNINKNKIIKSISLDIMNSLRQSDVIAEEEFGSYHILLFDTSEEYIDNIINRVVKKVQNEFNTDDLQYTIERS